MRHTFTRQELYDLVWSEPMKTLAGQFELSDVGLAKACKKANIPRPPRGYWAKLAAGKKVIQTPLPPRGPGMSDELEVGGSRYGYYYSEEEILDSDPKPPVFHEDIEDVASRIRKMIPRVTVPPFPEHAHRQIRRMLEADEERRQKQLASRFPSSWNAPIFDDPFEKRRLRILNAIFTALERTGMKPSVQGKEARDLDVMIHDTRVSFTLDATSQKPDPYRRSPIETRGSSTKLRFALLTGGPSSGTDQIWEETDKKKIEPCMTEIVQELIIAGERHYRDGCQRHYDWMVKRKSDVLEKIRKQREEAERKERERLAALEQARIDRLMRDAANFRMAADIRTYVKDVAAQVASGDVSVSQEDLNTWSAWALAQAERIDPARSGRYLDAMRDKEPQDDAGEE